jgi:hypothetical protein
MMGRWATRTRISITTGTRMRRRAPIAGGYGSRWR